jgi:UDP-N-acetylglucosamine 2-epimerase (non-hydrolysing)
VLADLGLAAGEFFVVSAHREENVDDRERLATLIHTLEALGEEFGKTVLFSTHPRTRARLDASGIALPPGIRFVKPLGFFDYVKLQMHASCVVSDSGTITEEAALLGLRAVTIRESHERPEGMDQGTLVMTGLRRERVLHAVRVVQSQSPAAFSAPPDYAADNVSQKVVRLILSYTDFVRRTVWYQ